MTDYKQIVDDDLNDGFPTDFDVKKHNIKGISCSIKQRSSIDDYTVERLGTIVRKTKPIFECIGQMLMDFGEGIENMTGGTGTVFKKLPYNHFLVLTCAHNLVKYDKIQQKKEEPNNVWFLPKGSAEPKCRLQFIDKEIYNEYKPENDLCPHDLAICLFYDKKGSNGRGSQHYENLKVTEVVQVIEWKDDDNEQELNLYGYPCKSHGLLQGTAGEAELKRDRGLWIYHDIYTFPGQSGAAIFKRIRKTEYGIYGIHIFGDIVKQQNCGIFIDSQKREWIKGIVTMFEANFKAIEQMDVTVKTVSKAVCYKAKTWLSDIVGLNDNDISILFDNGYDDMETLQSLNEKDLNLMEIKRCDIKKIMYYIDKIYENKEENKMYDIDCSKMLNSKQSDIQSSIGALASMFAGKLYKIRVKNSIKYDVEVSVESKKRGSDEWYTLHCDEEDIWQREGGDSYIIMVRNKETGKLLDGGTVHLDDSGVWLYLKEGNKPYLAT